MWNRIGLSLIHILFKQGVDLNVLGQIIAYDTDIDEGEYQRLRGRAIRDKMCIRDSQGVL